MSREVIYGYMYIRYKTEELALRQRHQDLQCQLRAAEKIEDPVLRILARKRASDEMKRIETEELDKLEERYFARHYPKWRVWAMELGIMRVPG